jgi:hypothetical protein
MTRKDEMGVTKRVEYDSQKGRQALERAFAVIERIEKESATATAASFLTVGRGAVARPDREYAEALIEIANYNMTDERRDAAMAAFRRGERPEISTMYGPRLQHLVEVLDQICANPARAAERFGVDWEQASAGNVVSIPTFTRGTDGLEPAYRTVISGIDAAYAHVFRLLASPPLSRELFRCALDSCQRFFLFDFDREGPPPTYCVDNDGSCSSQAKREKTRARVKRWRKKQ